jgi:mono/diheme cytochrome c family protein
MRTKPKYALLLLALLVPAAVWAMPWSRDMVVQQIVRPLLVMFSPAPGAVTVGSVPMASNEVAERVFRNPLAATPENLAAGKKFYDIHCGVCHGAGGRGDGPVAGGAMAPADLTSPVIQARGDGYIYGVIRNGVRSMPAYHESLNSTERWQVVLFVRTFAAEARSRGR